MKSIDIQAIEVEKDIQNLLKEFFILEDKTNEADNTIVQQVQEIQHLNERIREVELENNALIEQFDELNDKIDLVEK